MMSLFDRRACNPVSELLLRWLITRKSVTSKASGSLEVKEIQLHDILAVDADNSIKELGVIPSYLHVEITQHDIETKLLRR